MKQKVILASGSSRREELLKQLIDDFSIIESEFVEDNSKELKPLELVLYHAIQKARIVAKEQTYGIVIGADTLVLLNGIVLGKPKKVDQAKKMLALLSGKVIDVITAVTVIDVKNQKEISDVEITKVYLKKLSAKEIEEYVRTKEPLDKAGAFAIQGKGAALVERIEGDYSNVVGLPLFMLTKLLDQFGISIYEK